MSETSRAVFAVRRLRAPAAVAYDAWLDTEVARRWLFATATAPNRAVDMDVRVGGAFRFVAREHGGDVAYAGRYLELVAPHRLAFTLTREANAAPTRVVVAIASAGAGCRVAVAQHGVLRDAATRARARARWIGMLHGLDEILGDAVPDARWRRLPPRRAASRLANSNAERKEPTWTTC